MIHCSQCKREILHGAPFVRYSAFAYCSNECLYQYSLAPNSHVWSEYARAIDPETDGYEDVYADVEREEETLLRNVETVLRMMRATRAKNAQTEPGQKVTDCAKSLGIVEDLCYIEVVVGEGFPDNLSRLFHIRRQAMTNGNGSALCAPVQVFGGVRGYEQDGVAYLHIEDVARGLGFTQTKGETEYVRWETVDKYLSDLSFPTSWENGNPHDYYVPENIFYRLCMKARNEVAEAFQAKVADEIIPSIRKTGSYSMTPTDYVAALRALADEVEARQKAQRALEAEIVAHEADMKTARKTKAHFIEGRDAEMCGRVGGLTKENERLRTEIGDSRNWKQVKAIKWLGDYFALSKGLFGAIAYKLKGISEELELPRKDIEDSQYGTVKIYHVKAIEELHGRIDRDPNYLSKYRKVA